MFREQLYRKILREKKIPCCVPFARNGKPHSYSPVIISLRRTIHGNRIREGVRITHSVIFRSTTLGTLANVFWNTRQAYLPWHEYQRCLFHLASRCQKFYTSSRSLSLLAFLYRPLSISRERRRSEIKQFLNFAEVVKDSFAIQFSKT